MAAAQVRAGDKEAARKLFADAIEMAQAQGDTMNGGEALADIAAAQAEVGKFTAALETARKIENTDRQAIALAYIAGEQAQLGNKEEAQSLLASALETAQESIVSNAEILGLIAISLARAGEFTLAFETLEHADFDDEESAEEIYESVYGEIGIIGIRQVKSGQPEAAWKRFFAERETQIEEWIRNGHNLYLLDIAAAFAEAGDYRIFERLLIACAYAPRAAYRMCGLLLQIYPEQVEAIAAVVMRER